MFVDIVMNEMKTVYRNLIYRCSKVKSKHKTYACIACESLVSS